MGGLNICIYSVKGHGLPCCSQMLVLTYTKEHAVPWNAQSTNEIKTTNEFHATGKILRENLKIGTLDFHKNIKTNSILNSHCCESFGSWETPKLTYSAN